MRYVYLGYGIFLTRISRICKNYIYIYIRNLGIYILGMCIPGKCNLSMHILECMSWVYISWVYISLDMYNCKQNIRIWRMVPRHLRVPNVTIYICAQLKGSYERLEGGVNRSYPIFYFFSS
jgi:hypothetical protein